ncbi:MAG: hypothetical protein V1874_01790 [Spirochaetota bacterium]
MPKPTKNAALICAVLSVLALIGIIIGLLRSSALIITIFLIPAVVYEVYRTEGESTKAASIILLVIFILEIVLLGFNINFDLAKFLGKSETYLLSYNVPLGDVKVVAPAVMAVLSVVLFLRTNGIYTKWLSVIIFITSFAIIYTVDPENFKTLLKIGTDAAIQRVQ